MKLTTKPQRIDEYNWYYEKRDGIELIHEVYVKSYLQTDHIKIPPC